ncbi:MAG: exo-beta-N-acetylmuramidase NamZ domain-containing protein [Hyphomicrobiaceae bacterium]
MGRADDETYTRRRFVASAAATLAAIGATETLAQVGAGPALMRPREGQQSVVKTGADKLHAQGFGLLTGRRVGLITNHTGRVGEQHLVDLLAAAEGVKLTAILAPEHGFRGAVEAGKKVGDERDAKTGVPIFSLYGATRKPTPVMLANVDVLVFDIQDIGARFYTYISTMGLAMQAAAAARIPFIVLDRPNPLGGTYVDGFVLEKSLRSFVGQYPIPIVHGMTVGELARMIKGQRYLDGLEKLELDVITVDGWQRAMRWPATGLSWVPTSPNIPTFESALVYPGIGMVGELTVNEGRGTPTPFQLFGAPWLDGARLASRLDTLKLAGVRFEPHKYTPRAIAGVAAEPRFVGQELVGVRVVTTDVDQVRPLDIGMHALALIVAEARAKGIAPIYGNEKMFHAIAGTRRLHALLESGADGARILASWQLTLNAFRRRRDPYLLYS